ncbi:MAG: hypothetical protein AB9922_06555 [Bacteroidales bacterium]
MRFTSLLLSVFLFSGTFLYAQEESVSSVEFSAGGEVVSSYLWRGQNYNHNPSVQPWAELSWKGFTLGCWSAFRIKGEGDDEVNFYISKNVGFLTLSIQDYWSYSKTSPSKYFDYTPETTSHMFEGSALLSVGEKNNFNLLISYLFYGSDASKSIYTEAEYVRGWKSNEIRAFAGYQLKGEYYAEKNGFVNLGCTYRRELNLKSKIIPYCSLSFIFNPSINSTYFIVAVGI